VTGAVATTIGPIGFAVTGLAFDPTTGILYGCTSNNSAAHPRSIVTIDPATGTGTFVGALGLGSRPAADIAFNAAGQLYGWLGTASAPWLITINKTTGAAATVGGSSSSVGGGLSFTSGDVLWHVPLQAGDPVVTVIPGTGAETTASTLGAGPGGGGPDAAAFNSTDVLYAFWNYGSGTPIHLVTINGATGVVTDIGATDNLMDGLAWSLSVTPPPTPAITASPSTAEAGTAVSVDGTNFDPSSPLSATFDGFPVTLSGTTDTDGSGDFAGALFALPVRPAGTYTLTFTT
jgi:hypothetical protein